MKWWANGIPSASHYSYSSRFDVTRQFFSEAFWKCCQKKTLQCTDKLSLDVLSFGRHDARWQTKWHHSSELHVHQTSASDWGCHDNLSNVQTANAVVSDVALSSRITTQWLITLFSNNKTAIPMECWRAAIWFRCNKYHFMWTGDDGACELSSIRKYDSCLCTDCMCVRVNLFVWNRTLLIWQHFRSAPHARSTYNH